MCHHDRMRHSIHHLTSLKTILLNIDHQHSFSLTTSLLPSPPIRSSSGTWRGHPRFTKDLPRTFETELPKGNRPPLMSSLDFAPKSSHVLRVCLLRFGLEIDRFIRLCWCPLQTLTTSKRSEALLRKPGLPVFRMFLRRVHLNFVSLPCEGSSLHHECW